MQGVLVLQLFFCVKQFYAVDGAICTEVYYNLFAYLNGIDRCGLFSQFYVGNIISWVVCQFHAVVLEVFYNYRDDKPFIIFSNAVGLYLFCCIMFIVPFSIEIEILPKPCSFIFSRKFFAFCLILFRLSHPFPHLSPWLFVLHADV